MNSGSRFERKFARSIKGGKRTPRSGADGGGDTTFEAGSLWSDWSFELKRRATLPKSLTGWLDQAESDIRIGDRRRPAIAVQEEGGRTIVAFYWTDLQTWVEALAEVGNAAHLRSLVRQLEHQIREVKEAIR